MKEISLVVGLHLLVFVLYMVVLSKLLNATIVFGVFFLPLHVLLCFVMGIVNYFSQDADKKESVMFALAHILSGIVVAMIGLSLCTKSFTKYMQ